MAFGPGPILYTGNMVLTHIDGKLLGLVETATISRSVGRQNVYANGSPKRADAIVTQISVSVQFTNLIPINSNKTLQVPAAQNTSGTGNVVVNSLVSEVYAVGHLITITDTNGNVLASATNCLFDSDSSTFPNTQAGTYSLQFTADDTNVFVANN